MPPKATGSRSTGKRKQSSQEESSEAPRLPEGQTHEARSANLQIIFFTCINTIQLKDDSVRRQKTGGAFSHETTHVRGLQVTDFTSMMKTQNSSSR
jgi:hypothetical protein